MSNSEDEPGLVELANVLDEQGMIGYTRAFVDDFRNGLNHISLDRFEWMQKLAKKTWSGVLLSLIHI